MNLVNLTELNAVELKIIQGGDIEHSGVDLERGYKRMCYVAHQVGDFIRGFISAF